MTRKKIFLPIITGTLMLMLTACGPSDEKLSEAESARSLLVEAKTNAEETYLDISDESLKSALDELSEKEAKIEALEFKKMNDKKIDEVLPTIKELTTQYQDLYGSLSDTLKSETEVKEEKEKHTAISVYFVNKTGLDLTEIVLHDLTTDAYSENYLGDGVILGNGYTLMGVSLDTYKDSSEWEFVVTDEADTDHILTCDDLRTVSGDEQPVFFTYDAASGTGKASFTDDQQAEGTSQESTEAVQEASAEESTGD